MRSAPEARRPSSSHHRGFQGAVREPGVAGAEDDLRLDGDGDSVVDRLADAGRGQHLLVSASPRVSRD
jgi:hypothetical protein